MNVDEAEVAALLTRAWQAHERGDDAEVAATLEALRAVGTPLAQHAAGDFAEWHTDERAQARELRELRDFCGDAFDLDAVATPPDSAPPADDPVLLGMEHLAGQRRRVTADAFDAFLVGDVDRIAEARAHLDRFTEGQ